jgi:ribosomal protein L37AE/L43A
LSATANPDVVGGILIVVVIGFVVLYAWFGSKKNSHTSSGFRCKNCKSSNYSIANGIFHCNSCGHTASINGQPIPSASVYSVPKSERDSYEEGVAYGRGIEDGRRSALEEEEIRIQNERIRKQNLKDAQKYFDNITLTGLDPPRFDDPYPPKRQKKKRSIWDY